MPQIVKITDHLSKELICLDLKGNNKEDVLKELSSLIGTSASVLDEVEVHRALLEREKLGSTGIGKGVAIPHAKTESATRLTIAFGISRKGINFESLDKEDVNIFFVFASPIKDSQIYLKVLARISRLIRDEEFRNRLLSVETPEGIIDCINKEETL